MGERPEGRPKKKPRERVGVAEECACAHGARDVPVQTDGESGELYYTEKESEYVSTPENSPQGRLTTNKWPVPLNIKAKPWKTRAFSPQSVCM